MILAKHAITVYNKYAGAFNPPMPPSDGWNRTVIRYAQWEDTADRNAAQTGATFIDKHISIIIPKTAKTGGKKYVTPLEWASLPVAQKLLAWTLNVDADYIALGEAPEITSSYTLANMRADFRNCLIKAVEDLSSQPVMPHWEIVGI